MSLLFNVKDLSIRRAGIRILDGINWTVNAGEHWAILGANGSGKTSLLKALTGYMTPTAGQITVLGEEYGESDWRELRKRIGVVSTSISHLVHDEDAGLEIVAGGRQAMIGYWGKISRSERERARRFLSLLRVPQAARTQMGGAFPGRTPTCPHCSRIDGRPRHPDSRRTLRRPRSRRSREIPQRHR